MLPWRTFCFVLFLVSGVPAQGQECAGGAGGGMDATGNQCGRPATDAESGSSLGTYARPVVSARTTHQVAVRTVRVMTAPQARARLTPAAAPAIRFQFNAVHTPDPEQTTKITRSQGALCSGGAEGGMDATGNQCNVDLVLPTYLASPGKY